jgi:hypothetical protein
MGRVFHVIDVRASGVFRAATVAATVLAFFFKYIVLVLLTF